MRSPSCFSSGVLSVTLRAPNKEQDSSVFFSTGERSQPAHLPGSKLRRADLGEWERVLDN